MIGVVVTGKKRKYQQVKEFWEQRIAPSRKKRQMAGVHFLPSKRDQYPYGRALARKWEKRGVPWTRSDHDWKKSRTQKIKKANPLRQNKGHARVHTRLGMTQECPKDGRTVENRSKTLN